MEADEPILRYSVFSIRYSPSTAVHHFLTTLCLTSLLAASAPLSAVEPPTAVPVEGQPFPALLTAVDASWGVTFTLGGKPRTASAAELVAWGSPAELGQEPLIILADGSIVAAEILEADKERITADSALFGSVKLPVETLAGLVFQPAVERHAQDVLLDQIATAEGNDDRVILLNGDQLRGRLETIRDNTVRLTTDVGPVDIKTDRIQSLVFNPALVRRSRPVGLHAVAGFRDGSRLIAQQLVVNKTSLHLTSPNGTTWTTAPEELVFLQPLGGRVVYLSDRKAAAYRYVPYLTLTWPYHNDRNVSGSMLHSGGLLYLKGLGMHSASRLTYVLPEQYRSFQAELAIDDSTDGRGSVRFRVFVDGREKYTSPIIRGGTPPLPIAVDLSGAKRLDLIVEYADRADEQDHANWLQARLVR